MSLPEQICMGREQAEEIINALDTAQAHFLRGPLNYRPSDEDRAQVARAYDLLVAIVAEHSDLEG